MVWKSNKLPTLSPETLHYVAQELGNGVGQSVIAKVLGTKKGTITSIAKCIELGYPITDYQVIYNKDYRYSPRNESGHFYEDHCIGGTWDVRKGMDLLRLPFSQWRDAHDQPLL